MVNTKVAVVAATYKVAEAVVEAMVVAAVKKTTTVPKTLMFLTSQPLQLMPQLTKLLMLSILCCLILTKTATSKSRLITVFNPTINLNHNMLALFKCMTTIIISMTTNRLLVTLPKHTTMMPLSTA